MKKIKEQETIVHSGTLVDINRWEGEPGMWDNAKIVFVGGYVYFISRAFTPNYYIGDEPEPYILGAEYQLIRIPCSGSPDYRLEKVGK
jgi:hypothetical protein